MEDVCGDALHKSYSFSLRESKSGHFLNLPTITLFLNHIHTHTHTYTPVVGNIYASVRVIVLNGRSAEQNAVGDKRRGERERRERERRGGGGAVLIEGGYRERVVGGGTFDIAGGLPQAPLTPRPRHARWVG